MTLCRRDDIDKCGKSPHKRLSNIISTNCACDPLMRFRITFCKKLQRKERERLIDIGNIGP